MKTTKDGPPVLDKLPESWISASSNTILLGCQQGNFHVAPTPNLEDYDRETLTGEEVERRIHEPLIT